MKYRFLANLYRLLKENNQPVCGIPHEEGLRFFLYVSNSSTERWVSIQVIDRKVRWYVHTCIKTEKSWTSGKTNFTGEKDVRWDMYKTNDFVSSMLKNEL